MNKHSLLTPAGLVSMLALVVSLSGTAYAAATISGADIINGTVTTSDIKNGTLVKKDLAASLKGTIAQSGARAVAAVWADGSDCYVIAANSRGFTGACTKVGTGDFTLTLKPSVNTTYTWPICGLGSNGGWNTIYASQCDAQLVGASQVSIITTRTDETTTTSPRVLYDPSQTIPVVVVIP
jgi:hypothetical protein